MRTVAVVYDRRKSLFWTSPAVIDRRYSCLGLLLMLLSSSVASAQRQFTLNVDTQLVVETVTVRDKDGKTIPPTTPISSWIRSTCSCPHPRTTTTPPTSEQHLARMPVSSTSSTQTASSRLCRPQLPCCSP